MKPLLNKLKSGIKYVAALLVAVGEAVLLVAAVQTGVLLTIALTGTSVLLTLAVLYLALRPLPSPWTLSPAMRRPKPLTRRTDLQRS